MSRSKVLIKAFKKLSEQFQKGRSFKYRGSQIHGAGKQAAGKAQSVASASAKLKKPVPTLSINTRNDLKHVRRAAAAQQGVHYKKAVMPGYYQSMHRVRRKAAGAYGSAPNPIGPVARKSSTRKVRRKRRR